jgi:ubiquinone/menaquinone biosynthesis C-methylase UbiE
MNTSGAKHTTEQRAAKGYNGLGMEGSITRWYAKNTAKSLEEFKNLAKQIGGDLAQGSCVLEVAPGPGYLAIELAKLGWYRISGLDISKTFVRIARQNACAADVEVKFQRGDVAHMPYESHTFDFIVCRAAFKNFINPVGALNEMYRVLNSGGRALIIDLRRDAPKKTIDQYVDTIGLSWWDSFITKWTFELMLKRRAYLEDEIMDLVSKTPFEHLAIEETATGMEIRLKK